MAACAARPPCWRPIALATSAPSFGNPILKGESDVTFEPDGDGTLLTQEFRTHGIVSSVAARLFATGSYKGSFRGELEAFRQIAEREARPTMAP